jgi:hypothetical protein
MRNGASHDGVSDTEEEHAATLRSNGRLAWFVLLIGFACVLGLFAALILWAARPRWYTFVTRPTTTSPAFSLVLRVPVGWECREEGDTGQTDSKVITLRPRPLAGVWRWWQHVVLHENRTQDSTEQRSIQLIYADQPVGASSDSEYYRFLVAGWLESDLTATCRTFEHPLGPALERVHGQESSVHDEVTRIVVLRHPQGTRIEVIASRTAPTVDLNRTRTEWDQILSSIRVVQK